jgi:ATP-dependent DNA helicase RecQ
VPAYVVFNNKTLDDLVARRPTDYVELRACTGIGPAKIEAYGDDLLAVIAAF